MPKKAFAFCFFMLLSCSLLFAKEEYPYLGLITRNDINVRSGASVNFETICKLSKNDKVSVVGKSYDWYKIILPKGATCFVNEKYLSIEDSVGSSGSMRAGFVTGDRVNVRAKPGENFSIVGRLNKGDKVKIVKKTGEWYGIEPTESCFGWVHSKFVSFYAELNKGKASVSCLADKGFVSRKEPVSTTPKVQKKEAKKEEITAGKTVSASGVLQAMGRIFNRSGTHKLVSGGKILYILSGDRAKLDNFISYKVKVVGEINNSVSSKYPVIIVKEITACE